MLKFHFKIATLRCFFAIINNLVQCIPCSQYILADRFLRNSGYLVEREVFLTFGCQFPSKTSFEKSKRSLLKFESKRSLLKFDFKMAVLRCFFAIKIKLVQCILCGQYILADRFLGTVVTWLNMKFCRLLGVNFHQKEILRNLKIPKFA